MELRHNGVRYEFDYEFAPQDETGGGVTPVPGHPDLAGTVHITSVVLNGRSVPVDVEILAKMKQAAALEIINDVARWYRERRRSIRQAQQRRRPQVVEFPRG